MHALALPLAATYRVLAPDLPGHGTTPPPPEPWGVPEYARLIAAFMASEGLRRAPIIGHSNGGRIALYMASEPEFAPLIERLVLISPSGIRPSRSAGYYLRSGLARTLKAPMTLLPPRLRAIGMDWLRHTWIWPMLGSSDFRQLQGVMRETFVKTVTCYLEDRLDRITAPVLILWGTRDDAISHTQMTTLVSGLPNATLVPLQDAGHYGYLDQPALTSEAITRFLEPTPAA